MRQAKFMIYNLFIVLIISQSLNSLNHASQNPVKYANNETKRIINKMLDAHGGYDKWKSAPSISYFHEMIAPSDPDDPWTSVEIIEQGRRRVYAEWPNDKAILGFDGKKVWSKDWKRKNPPKMMVNVAYFFLNLPWITQDKSALLGEVETEKFPVSEISTGDFYKIRMTYDEGNPYEYYDLYINKSSFMLEAVKYTVTFAALMDLFKMPPDTKFMGPLTKVYYNYQKVDGLKFASNYDTYRPNGQKYGLHTVKDFSISKKFDPSKVKMPEGAVVDNSSRDKRKHQQ